MTLVKVISTRGAPKETVRIYKSGTARLSQDLVISSAFDLWVDEKNRTLNLIPPTKWRPSTLKTSERRRVWYGNSVAKSAFISIQTALDMLHLTPEKAYGLYRGVVVDGCVVIQLRKKIKE